MSEKKEIFSSGIWLYGYAVALGVVYAFAFSRPFGLNLLEFFAIQDYLSVPLNRAIIILALPALIAIMFFDKTTAVQKGLGKFGFWILMLAYGAGFVTEAHRAIRVYLSVDFHFRNEINVIALMCIALLISVLTGIRANREARPLLTQLIALVLIQVAVISAAGYSDGKAIYAGAAEVYFLENKDLCGPVGTGNWVLVTRLSSVTVFMNTADKRLCLTDEQKYRLISRVRLEGLDQD